MLITQEFNFSKVCEHFPSLVCTWQPPLVLMNWPFNPIQPQLMQTTRGIGVYTRQLHKHKHVLTFTAMIEVEAWNLGESEWAHFQRADGVHVWGVEQWPCVIRGMFLSIILGVWTHRIWYYFHTVIINCFISSERMDRVYWRAEPFLKLHTRCWGHLSCLIFTEMKANSNECTICLQHIQSH